MVPAEVRARWAARLESEGVAALHAELAVRDPRAAATLRPSDPQRVLRALEVFEAAGRSLQELQQAAPVPPLLPLEATAAFVLEAEREVLYRRIEERVERMVAAGALDEVRALAARGLDGSLPAMKAIGVREFSAVTQRRGCRSPRRSTTVKTKRGATQSARARGSVTRCRAGGGSR